MSTHFESERINLADWISQAEAARLRQVSRQAIAKLVSKGRIRSIKIGGHILVHRGDVEGFKPKEAGRPKSQKDKHDQS